MEDVSADPATPVRRLRRLAALLCLALSTKKAVSLYLIAHWYSGGTGSWAFAY
jgi:hypothetical protein